MFLVGRSVVILIAAVLPALPAAAAADGIMLVQAGAFWMGATTARRTRRRNTGSTSAISGSSATR